MVCIAWDSADGQTRFRIIGRKTWLQEEHGRRQPCLYLVESARDDEKESITLYDKSSSMYYLLTSSASYWGPIEAFQSQPTGGDQWHQHVYAGRNGWIRAEDEATQQWPNIEIPLLISNSGTLPEAVNVAGSVDIKSLLEQHGFSLFHGAFDKNPVDIIVEHLERTKQVFIDPWFERVGQDEGTKLTWVRPGQLATGIVMFQDVPTPICPGAIQNSGTRATAAALYGLRADAFKDAIYPTEVSPHGVYSVRIEHYGRTGYILLDDLFPVFAVLPDKLWSWSTPGNSQAWPMFLEKYLAKRNGGYVPPSRECERSLTRPASDPSDLAFSHNLFHVASRVDMADDCHWKEMCEHLGSDAIGCIALADEARAFADLGVAGSHSHAVVGAASVGNSRFLRLHKNQGDSKSALWDKHLDVKEMLGKPDTDDSTYWVEFADVVQNFWLKGRFNMQYLASESHGYRNRCITGIITPSMREQFGACPAIEVQLPEDSVIFWHAECLNARFSEDYLRLYTTIWKLENGMEPQMVMSTKNSFSSWGVEAHHRLECKAGEYAISVHPMLDVEHMQPFFVRIASQPAFYVVDGHFVPLGTIAGRLKVKPRPDTVKTIKQQFNSLDPGTGKVTVDDFSDLLRQLGLSAAETNVMTKEADRDGSGRIDVNNLVDWLFLHAS